MNGGPRKSEATKLLKELELIIKQLKKEMKDATNSQGKKGNVGHAKKLRFKKASRKRILRQRKQRSDKGRPRGKYKTKKG